MKVSSRLLGKAPGTVRLAILTPLLAVLVVGGVGCPHGANCYEVRNLVSDGFDDADHTDENLVNGWGVAFTATSFAWVVDNGTGKATLYDGAGNPQPLVVTIPSVDPEGTGSPTGIVANTTEDFVVSDGKLSGPARFIFVSEDGLITGWNTDVTASAAEIAYNGSEDEAIYKGVALASTDNGNRLYATDFHNSRVDVFDGDWNLLDTDGGFVDDQLPEGYGPFGIAHLRGHIYVTYAKQDEDREDDVAGPGFGYIDVYNTDGQLRKRLVQGAGLNAPWGLAIAPSGFGRFSHSLLVSNFGDGTISAYRPGTGFFMGTLEDDAGEPIVSEGIWGIAFGNDQHDQPSTTLFFAAGPGDEEHGLYGKIEVCP